MTNSAAEQFNAADSFNIVWNVGCLRPVSIQLTKTRATPASSASFSWLQPAFTLLRRNARPNASAGSTLILHSSENEG